MNAQERLKNVQSNIASLSRQLESVLVPPIKLMLEVQLAQLLELEQKLKQEVNNG